MELFKKIIIYLLLFTSITLFITVTIFIPRVNVIEQDRKNEVTESENHNLDEVVVSNVIYVDNMDSLFTKYTGEISRAKLSKFIREMTTKNIYDLKKQDISEEIFNSNKKDYVLKYGTINYLDLINLKQKISDYSDEVTKISIVPETVITGEQNATFSLTVTFKNNSIKTFQFNIRNILSLNEVENPNIIYVSK